MFHTNSYNIIAIQCHVVTVIQCHVPKGAWATCDNIC